MPTFPLEARMGAAVLVILLMAFISAPFAEVWPVVKNWLQGKETTHPPKPVIWVALLTLILVGATTQVIAVAPTAETRATDLASFVTDVSVPDDSQLAPGQPFDKEWRLYNGGETEWTDHYEARRANKEGLPATNFGPDGFHVPRTSPGHDAILSAAMTAPLIPGCYRNRYRMYHGDTQFGEAFSVQIVVADQRVADYVLWLDHLNVRDGTSFPVGATFRKGWVMHNCGRNTWANYRLIRIGGTLAGPAEINVPVTSGQQDVAIWADFTAPSSQSPASGATYQLQNAEGSPVANGTLEVTIKTYLA
jgi:hypothetical protein